MIFLRTCAVRASSWFPHDLASHTAVSFSLRRNKMIGCERHRYDDAMRVCHFGHEQSTKMDSIEFTPETETEAMSE